MDDNPVNFLSKKSGKTKATIYRMYHILGRLPTLEEVINWKRPGRPRRIK